MNTKLLEKTIKSIQEEPRGLDMRYWAKQVNPTNPKNPPCGTKACIAGHVAFCSGKLAFNENGFSKIKGEPNMFVANWAREALKLNSEQADRLFYFARWNEGIGWPKQFSVAYNKAKTAKQRAKVAIARIRHFIKTEGEE